MCFYISFSFSIQNSFLIFCKLFIHALANLQLTPKWTIVTAQKKKIWVTPGVELDGTQLKMNYKRENQYCDLNLGCPH